MGNAACVQEAFCDNLHDFLPWISIPVLKYSKLPTTYTFWNFDECVQNVKKVFKKAEG